MPRKTLSLKCRKTIFVCATFFSVSISIWLLWLSILTDRKCSSPTLKPQEIPPRPHVRPVEVLYLVLKNSGSVWDMNSGFSLGHHVFTSPRKARSSPMFDFVPCAFCEDAQRDAG